MRLAAVPAKAPFLDVVARRWLAEHAGHAGGLVLLPTRRAARALAEAFLRATEGAPLLLPRITALGALDETPLALSGVLDLPPAVAPMRRLAELTRLVLALPERHGGVAAADRAWMLARELAVLMDEAERAELDLPAALLAAAEGDYATHWQVTLRFLEIVTRSWPEWLAGQGLCNPAWRQVRLLRAQAAAWGQAPPPEPVWIAGVTGGIPAAAELVRVVAALPGGLVLLPGLDAAMAEDEWAGLEPAHPQAGLARLLAGLGARRGDVAVERSNGGRFATLAAALAPAAALARWGQGPPTDLAGLALLASADPQAEAAAIAMVLRDAIAAEGAKLREARAAFVTPDRALAVRVAAELLRWGIVADDSAGEPLAETPPAAFLRLLARAVDEDFAPVPLLALLKHPFAACGLSRAACRDEARRLELHCLRGPRPLAGLTGLREAAEKAGGAIPAFLARVEACLAPLLRPDAAVRLAPADHLAGLVAAAEALAATDEAAGPERLWADEEGEALAALLAEALEALPRLPDQSPAVLPGLLDALLEGAVVRSRRALRGRDGATGHPRVFIWGLLEARLQSVETLVLGGLVEGVWPAATDPGPWMSRPMRARAGLPSPEEAVGQGAHDFVMAACSAPTVILSYPRRRNGAPAVPSRWLVRLEAMLAGRGLALPHHPAAEWAAALDLPPGAPTPVGPPMPCPPVAMRPTRLSVTEIETWIADPYAIHARHVLRLRALDPLDQATDAADYGQIVHAGLHRFLERHAAAWPPDGRGQMRLAMQQSLAEARLRLALREWWEPRLLRIADWVAEQEIARRAERRPAAITAEVRGSWLRDGFELTGRADRIERRPDGTLAILDYKTGALPTRAAADGGDAPQLPLEAAMAEAGAFGAAFQGAAAELVYWHLSGGHAPGEARAILASRPDDLASLVADVRDRLARLVHNYRDPARPYLSQPHPGRVPRFSDYAQLARVAEWGGGSEPE